MGLVLFVASSVSGERVETIARAILPFLAVEVVVIFLITYIPAHFHDDPPPDGVRATDQSDHQSKGRKTMLEDSHDRC